MTAAVLALLATLAGVFGTQWPAAPLKHVAAGQVEQESGWKTSAKLDTSRELGLGLAQITITYKKDGTERFNNFREGQKKYSALRAWDWQDDPCNVRYQLTYLVLEDRANYQVWRKSFTDDAEAWKATLVSYNAGRGRVLRRRAAARAAGVPWDRWTGGLDRVAGPDEIKPLYGRRLSDAVNEYPIKIFQRSEKYRGML